MIGSSTTAPTSRNHWLAGGAAACQIEIEGGTISGYMLIPRPAKHTTNQPSAQRNGVESCFSESPRQKPQPNSATSNGAGAVSTMPGQPNQRWWNVGLSIGV